MLMSISDARKKRGRGRPYLGGPDHHYGFRAPKDLIERLDDWAAQRGLNRAEAIREILTQVLQPKNKNKR